jgi:hypothetical protein
MNAAALPPPQPERPLPPPWREVIGLALGGFLPPEAKLEALLDRIEKDRP